MAWHLVFGMKERMVSALFAFKFPCGTEETRTHTQSVFPGALHSHERKIPKVSIIIPRVIVIGQKDVQTPC